MSFFNRKTWSKQSVASWLVLVFLIFVFFLNILPKKEARAQNATVPMQIVQQITQKINWVKDYANQQKQKSYAKNTSDIQKWFKSDTLDRRSERESWNETRKDLLDDLVNDILESVQDMGDGMPAFVSDWKSFLGDFTQQAFQKFVDEKLNQAEMCGTFKQEVQQAISAGNEPSFQAQAQCPPNYDSAALLAGTSKNFWSDWLQMIRPSGNPFGAYMIASDKKLEAEGLAYTGRIFQLTADQGYRGTKETPGIIQSNAAQRASMMDLDYLLNSDDLEEYFGSVVDAFINRIINEGLQYMQTGTYAPQGKPPQFQPSQQTVDLDYVEINYETIIQISDLLALTEENLNILRTEQLRIATSTPPAPPAQTVAWLNWTDSAILAFEQLIIAAEQAIAAKATGDQALINQTIVSFKTSQTTAVNALMTLLNTRETNLSKLFSKLDDFNSDIVDEINRIIILYRLYGN